MDIEEYFRKLRFDPQHHLGLGDIRLTIGQQEEINIAYIKLQTELADSKVVINTLRISVKNARLEEKLKLRLLLPKQEREEDGLDGL